MSPSPFSTPRAIAGSISVPRSIARISWTGMGRGMERSTKAMKGRISGILLARI